ncbi:neurogenic locus notch protein 4 [Trichuris trichiura]|uniref:Neurogenic locus notch protein 4 n=1 Tax=Trichuris trichiura TaxID=36087 RepID=A0A077ZMJ1_TRITR|nr:neurogenic locus notch protein 4 [Trichuris trichiura]
MICVNCNYKKVEHCHFDDTDNKWYKYAVSILSQAQSPFGIPCPIGIPREWKRDSLTCCMATKVLKYNDSCTDFASNTTINLRKQGCNNNGTIARDSYGHLKCVCPDRYIGIQCEEDVCEGTCLNGGTCVPARGKPHCFCRRGFTGSNCSEALKSCGESGTCQNGGTCETLVIGAEEVKVCKCKDGYGGVTCEREVQKCEDDSCNYNGVCRENAEYGMIECTCYESYQGEYCDKKDGKLIERLINPTPSNVVNVVVGFVLGFLMLTLCFGGAAVHHRRRRRRGGHSYESSFSTAISSRASTFSTAISRAFGRQQTVKAKTADTRSLAKGSSKAVGISKVG